MAESPLIEQVLTMFDDKRYPTMAQELGERYRTNRPFSHIGIDHFLPFDLAYELAMIYPDEYNAGWTVHEKARVNRKFLGDETKSTRSSALSCRRRRVGGSCSSSRP